MHLKWLHGVLVYVTRMRIFRLRSKYVCKIVGWNNEISGVHWIGNKSEGSGPNACIFIYLIFLDRSVF